VTLNFLFPLKTSPNACYFVAMTHEIPFENGAPDHDEKIASTSGVLRAATEGRLTDKLAKFLDLMDDELAENSVQKLAE
jgi:hypothetical protein